jgi:hypothetical protein
MKDLDKLGTEVTAITECYSIVTYKKIGSSLYKIEVEQLMPDGDWVVTHLTYNDRTDGESDLTLFLNILAAITEALEV